MWPASLFLLPLLLLLLLQLLQLLQLLLMLLLLLLLPLLPLLALLLLPLLLLLLLLTLLLLLRLLLLLLSSAHLGTSGPCSNVVRLSICMSLRISCRKAMRRKSEFQELANSMVSRPTLMSNACV